LLNSCAEEEQPPCRATVAARCDKGKTPIDAFTHGTRAIYFVTRGAELTEVLGGVLWVAIPVAW